jgi:hypothetical protein
LIDIFSREGFDLNNLTLIPRHFGKLGMVMATMIGILHFFFGKREQVII